MKNTKFQMPLRFNKSFLAVKALNKNSFIIATYNLCPGGLVGYSNNYQCGDIPLNKVSATSLILFNNKISLIPPTGDDREKRNKRDENTL